MLDPASNCYTPRFYAELRDGSRASARRILPEVLALVKPTSIVDVGCGVGTWLVAAEQAGLSDYLGIDGDYVDVAQLEIPRERFVARDLQQPLQLDRQFDLVMSLEVAEHLPPDRADAFVASLTGLGPVVLFSAAIPHQNGNNHLNEQWPEYWADRFRARGYLAVDCVRSRVWNDPAVEPWYAQNTLLFVREDRLRADPALAAARAQTVDGALSRVHPEIYRLARFEAALQVTQSKRLDGIPLKRIIAQLPSRLVRSLREKVRGLDGRAPGQNGFTSATVGGTVLPASASTGERAV